MKALPNVLLVKKIKFLLLMNFQFYYRIRESSTKHQINWCSRSM